MRAIVICLIIAIASLSIAFSPIDTAWILQDTYVGSGNLLLQAANETVANVTTPGNVTTVTTTLTVTFTYTPEPITITRPPTGSEIGVWIAGGIVIGLFIGAGIGYAIFAQGVTVKREKRRGPKR